jgi:hypothetical protein
MASPIRIVAALAFGCVAFPAGAVLVFEPLPEAAGREHKVFYEQLRKAVSSLASSTDPHVRRLHAAAAAAPAKIRFRPITDDPGTWASDGDRDRGHTEPADGRPKREGRTRPTGAIIHLPPWGVDMASKRWGNGLLVHELVHALDLASGRYNPNNRVRERRAVFMANIWRDRIGHDLRTDYHGEFATLDYQEAKRQGRIDEYAGYLFARINFPVTPANAAADAGGRKN